MVDRAMMSQAAFEKISVAVMLTLGLVYWVPTWVNDYRDTVRQDRELAAISAENFLEVNAVFVNDTVQGTDAIMVVNSIVFVNFPGEYSVIVKDALDRTAVCTASDSLTYKTRETALPPQTLSWWANDGECTAATLSPGAYYVDTTWWISHGVPGYERTTVNVESNVFTVHSSDVQQKLEQLEQEVQELRIAD